MNPQWQAACLQGPMALLKLAQEEQVSDLHFTPGAESVCLTLRKKGHLHTVGELSPTQARSLIQAFKASAQLNIADTRRPQDGRISQGEFDVRLATHPSVHGESLVLRVLNRRVFLTLNELGLAPAVLTSLQTSLDKMAGLTLVVGATGSGKTTTLHALLHHLGDGAGRIATLEDPVEIIHPRALQTDLTRSPALNFASGLRSLMRQDPDTLMVGEIRDEETAALCIQAALTGHRVLASLHAPDCLGALARLIELGVRLNSLLNCTNGVLAQRLLPAQGQQAQQLEVEWMNLLALPRANLLACTALSEVHALVHRHRLSLQGQAA